MRNGNNNRSLSIIVALVTACSVLSPAVFAQTGIGAGPIDTGEAADFVEEWLEELTGKVLENVIGSSLSAINNTTDDKATGTLLLLLEGSTGMALDDIKKEIVKTQGMIQNLQNSVNAFQSDVTKALDEIIKVDDQNALTAALKSVNSDDGTLDQLSTMYNNIINSCYSNGVLNANPTNLTSDQQLAISTFITSVDKANIPQILTDLATAAEAGNDPSHSVYTTYDNAAKAQYPFEHQTYPGMYSLYNRISSLRATALTFYKEFQSYQWKTQNTNGMSLDQWLFYTYTSLYGTPTLTNVYNDVILIPKLSKIYALLQNVDTNVVTNVVAFLADSINQTTTFIDDNQNKITNELYQVTSNVDGNNYLIVKKAAKVPLIYHYDGGYNAYYKTFYMDYTLNHRYTLAFDVSDIQSLLKRAGNYDTLTWLISNAGGNLSGLDPRADGIILARKEAKSYMTTMGETVDYQNLYLLDAQHYNAAVTDIQYLNKSDLVSNQDMYDGKTYTFAGDAAAKKLTNATFLSIYRDTHISCDQDASGYYKPATAEQLGDIFSLDDGDVLDLSAYSGAFASHKTARICGTAKIIGGGSNQELSNIYIEIYGGSLAVENLFLTSKSNVINNVYGAFILEANGINRLKGASDDGVVLSTNGDNVIITGQGSLVITNSSSGPAIKTTGSFIAYDATNLTFSSQGATSISAGQTINITNSTIKSWVAKESNNEFKNPQYGMLENSTLNMTYGAINFGVNNCKWNGNMRYTVVISTESGPSNSTTGTDDPIDLKLVDNSGKSISWLDLGKIDGDQFEPGKQDTLYLSGKPFALSDINHVEFTSGGTDGWYPMDMMITLPGAAPFSMNLLKWVDNNNTTLFYPDDVCGNFSVNTADENKAGTSSAIYLSIVHDGGQASSEIRLDTIAMGGGFQRNSYDDSAVHFGGSNEFNKIEGIILRTDRTGNNPGWKVDQVVVFSPLFHVTVNPQMWILDADNKFFGLAETNTGEFAVKVITANVDKAGTDSKIFVKIIGTAGQTSFQNIKDIPTTDGFERGETNSFNMAYSQGIGTPLQLQIKTDQSGTDPGWMCTSIEISPIVNGQPTTKYLFGVNQWFTNASFVYTASNPTVTKASLLKIEAVLNPAWDKIVSWEHVEGRKLQSAPEVTGPWTEVIGATTPHKIAPPTSGRRFYRLTE